MTSTDLLEIKCYRCGSEPVGQCPQCRRPYCANHGARLCLDCRRAGGAIEVRIPLRGAPSSWGYRLALAGVVIVLLLVAWDSVQWMSSGGPTQARAVAQATWTPSPRSTASPAPAATSGATPTPTSETRTHTVAPGDTLSSIALNYGVSVQQLTSLNNISERDFIVIGQTLKIPPK